MNFHQNSRATVLDIIDHLQESSFNQFISWNNNVCTVSNLEIFPSVVLSTLSSGYSLESFQKELKQHNLAFKLTKKYLKIFFPGVKPNPRKRSRSISPLLEGFEEIEFKQEKILLSIKKAQEKLARALRINKHLKIELKKSAERQMNLLEERVTESIIGDAVKITEI